MKWDWGTALYGGKTIADELIGEWRHGVRKRRVFELEGKQWAVEYRSHAEYGVAEIDEGVAPKPYEVRPAERLITIWTPRKRYGAAR